MSLASVRGVAAAQRTFRTCFRHPACTVSFGSINTCTRSCADESMTITNCCRSSPCHPATHCLTTTILLVSQMVRHTYDLEGTQRGRITLEMQWMPAFEAA